MLRSPTPRRLSMASLVLGLGVGLLIVVALAPSDTRAAARTDGTVKDGGTLTIGALQFDFIDPALAMATSPFTPSTSATAAVWSVEDATCALLLRYPAGPPTGIRYRPVPEVASGYPAVSRDGKAYAFTIRKGYRFSTGEPVTAQSYANAMNRLLNPAMNAPAAAYLRDVVGATAVQQGKAATASGVRVAGNRLTIRLTKRAPDFPARTTMLYFCPVPAGLPINPEGVGAPLAGSGPYYFAEFVRGSTVVLKRNAFYRGPRPHHVDQIVVQVDVDGPAITRRVEAGEVDVQVQPPISQADRLVAKYGVNQKQLFSFAGPTVFYVVMNTSQPLFKDNPKLRRAVNFAIDRTKLAEVVGPLPYAGAVTDDYLPKVMPGYVDAHLYPLDHPDVKKAQELAAGHTRSGKAVLDICDNLNLGCLKHAQIIKENLAAIGIDVEINSFPYAVYAAKLATRGEPWDLAVDSHSVEYMDPSQYLDLMLDGRTIRPTENTNRAYFDSPQYEARMDQAGRLSVNARYDAYGKLAVDIARNAAPLAAFHNSVRRFFVSSRVGCVRSGAYGGVDLAGLCIM
jgi:ABC-type oligopeptide transport system substrate-binding subunit